MPSRRAFLREVAAASASALLLGSTLSRAEGQPNAQQPQAGASGNRRQIVIGGKRVKTVDMHTHTFVPEVAALLAGTNLEKPANAGARALGGGNTTSPDTIPVGPVRVDKMDRDGIDMQVLSINPFWYSADRDLASRLVDLQNEKLSAMCSLYPDRFLAFATVALQFPELAAQQMEDGMKRFGLRGANIGGNVEGQELSAPKFDPFWAKAEELQGLIFMHPQDAAVSTGISNRVHGSGALGNVIGNPLETSLFISHLIFDGTLDRFPNLKICCAHGGGFLPSYSARMDHGCLVFPEQCRTVIKKQPSEYLKQLYFDTLVYTPEALRHLAAVVGSGQLVMGTDSPIPWVPESPVDAVLATPSFTGAEKTAIVGGTARRLLGIPA
jgi:predicted TIM-barrel fold metal-dependent hydrolase